MKVIAIGERESLVIQVSHDEFANIAGFYATYATGFDKTNWCNIGSTVQVGSIYKEAKEALEMHGNAVDAAKKLRAAADKFLSFFQTTTK